MGILEEIKITDKIRFEKSLFFGDAINDIIAANNKNVPFIGIINTEESALLNQYPTINWFKNFINMQDNLLRLKYDI